MKRTALAALCLVLCLFASLFVMTAHAEGEPVNVTAVVEDGVASLPEGVSGHIDTLYVPADATDVTALFEGTQIDEIVLKSNGYTAESVSAITNAAPMTVYYTRPVSGPCIADELSSVEGITLRNLLGVYGELLTTVDDQHRNVVNVIGTINADDLDFDDAAITVTFKKEGMEDHVLRANVLKVYKTVKGVASTNEATATAQGIRYVEDAAYVYALAIKGVPNGVYTATATVTATSGGVAVTSGEITTSTVTVPTHDHVFEQSTVAPSGVTRGYTLDTCTICSYQEKEGPYDYSLYSGVDFVNNGKFLIPYNFDTGVYTIEATVNVPTGYAGRPGVIVGNYGSGAGFNFEIYTSGKPRLYFAVPNGKTTTAYNYYFNYDVRSDAPVNLALTFRRGEATLYADGEFVETIALGDFDIPTIGRTLVMGGDCRSGNSAAFKGTIYSVSIFRDYRTPEEIKADLVLADAGDPNCCVSYNLTDAGVLGGGVELSELEYVQVHNAEELEYYASVGVKEIEVMNDIVLDRTVYVVADVTIYANGDYTIIRDPGFAGDMFVIGENSVGRNLILEGFTCRLTFGKEGAAGTLTVDGNKSNTTVDVYGTLVYVNNSGIFNMTDQITLTNNRKTANSRTLEVEQWFSNAIGGAAIININGVVNMNGGVISNCDTNFTDPSSGDNTADNYLESCYGGAVFNYSNFVMNGGSIIGNTGYYGGAIANFLNTKINCGLFENNTTSHAGGAIYVYNNEMKELIIGSEDGDPTDVIFRGNSTTMSSGGAIYSGMKASVLIYGGVTFDGNSTYGNGGAVYIAGMGVIKGSTRFVNNSANGSGGAIYVTQDTDYYRRTVRISGAAFENNTAGTGGALSFRGSESYVDGCTFTGNSSRSNGGAVYINRISETFTIVDANNNSIVMEGQGADVTVTNCTFTDNTGNEAGALFGDAYCTVRVSDSTFSGNTAKSNGGAISLHGTALTLTNVDFENNVSGVPLAEGEEAGTGSGGAIYASYRTVTAATEETDAVIAESSVTINGGSYTGNSTAGQGNGGAVTLLTGNTGVQVLTLNDAAFTGNEAGAHGGAIYVANGTAAVNGSTFTDNTAASNGGAIYVTRAELTGNNDTFTGNVSNNNNYGGGAIYSTNSTVTLTSSVFTNNEAKHGGAVTGFTNSVITLYNTLATGNTARNQGGFAYMSGSSLTMNNTDGGSTTIGSLTDASLGNTAPSGGGAFYITNGSTASFTGVTAANNGTSGGSGGAFYVKDSANTSFTDCTISNNSAKYGGAAIVYGSVVTFDGVSIENNSATTWGGAFYVRKSDDEESPTAVTATNTTFSGNEATNTTSVCGGAVYLNSDVSFSAVGCSFTNNRAEYTDAENPPEDGANGGAIYMNSRSALSLDHCTFTGNTASTCAGALYVGVNCSVEIVGGSFEQNSAGEGGAVFGDRLTTVTLNGTAFRSNSSAGNGGAVSSHGTTFDFTDCVFENNTTGTGSGAGFYASYRTITGGRARTTATFTGGSFIGNSAQNNGGAIYATVSDVTVDGTTFDGNRGSYGGCVAAYTESVIVVKNVTATSNTAVRGAFAYVNASSLTVTADEGRRSVFGDTEDETLANTTTGGGGVFFIETGSTVEISHADAAYNTTSGSGGFAYMKSDFTMTDCTVTGSSAGYGGAMIIYGVNATVTDCTFSDCTSNNGMGGFFYIRQGDATDTEPASACAVTATGTTFSGGTSNGNGGVAYVNTNSSFSAVNCTFTGNTATTSGGAIYSIGDLSFSGCTFTGNTATTSGGAVYLKKTGGTIVCSDTTFDGNSSADGGAVWMQYPAVTMNDVVFENNSATGSGGAVYAHSVTGAITGISAQGNTANLGGWAYLNRSTLRIEGTADSPAIFGTTDETMASELRNNASSGGAIYSTVGVDLTVDNVTFGYNTAKNGGAITGSNANGCAITVTGSTFTGNSATANGGAIYGEGAASFTVSGSTFGANTAANGGAVYVTDNASYTDDDCVYESNTASADGGAWYLNTSGAIVSTDATFNGNSAVNGGAIRTLGQDITMSITLNDVTLTNNTATGSGSGGAIYAHYINYGDPDGAALEIHGITAQGNSASGGGVFYLNRATVNVDAGTKGALIGTADASLASTLGNTTTSGSGAVAYHTVGGYLNLDGVTVGYNTAGSLAGVAYVYHASGSGFTASDTTFVGNRGKSGGAFYAANIAVLTFTDCVFDSNVAYSGGGGAIYVKDNAVLSCTGCSFTGNSSSTSHGGAIYSYLAGTTADFTNCVFDGNTASGNGGAIYNSNATAMSLSDVTFRNNTTDGNGDGVFTTHGSGVTTSLTVNGLTVDQPSGTKTIFISQTNTNVTITRNSVVDLNHSPTDFSLIVYGSSASVINNSVTYV